MTEGRQQRRERQQAVVRLSGHQEIRNQKTEDKMGKPGNQDNRVQGIRKSGNQEETGVLG